MKTTRYNVQVRIADATVISVQVDASSTYEAKGRAALSTQYANPGKRVHAFDVWAVS